MIYSNLRQSVAADHRVRGFGRLSHSSRAADPPEGPTHVGRATLTLWADLLAAAAERLAARQRSMTLRSTRTRSLVKFLRIANRSDGLELLRAAAMRVAK